MVAEGWKEKHGFKLDTPGVEKYKAICDVQVQHVDDPAEANTVMTAQWVPLGTLDSRQLSQARDAVSAALSPREGDRPGQPPAHDTASVVYAWRLDGHEGRLAYNYPPGPS